MTTPSRVKRTVSSDPNTAMSDGGYETIQANISPFSSLRTTLYKIQIFLAFPAGEKPQQVRASLNKI
jgi:hypothetical protein